jgi:hypothetical protein
MSTPVQQAIAKFAPVYVFHPNERYLPLRFEKYVAGCSLRNLKTEKTLVEYPKLVPSDLIDPSVDPLLDLNNARTTKDVAMVIEDDQMPYGTSLTATQADRAVHYAYVSTVVVDGVTTYIDILYNLLYGYNSMAGDDHDFDSEYCVVRTLVKPDGSLGFQAMWTSRHGGGQWFTGGDLQFVDGHPVSYVALGSHANYITPGVQRRLWGFGNDLCAMHTDAATAPTLFRPSAVVLPKPDQPDFPGTSYAYMAYLGMAAPSGGNMMAWKPRFLNTIQEPPLKASDNTSKFIQKTMPGIDKYTWAAVTALLALVLAVEIVVFVRNSKSVGNASWQQLVIVVFTFLAGVLATYSHLLE